MIPAAVLLFFVILATSPTAEEWREEKRREREKLATAIVHYLPSNSARAGVPVHLRCPTCGDELPVCKNPLTSR